MTGIIGITFIIGCVVFYFYTKHEAEVDHLQKKANELEKEKAWIDIKSNTSEKKLEAIKHNQEEGLEEFQDFGCTSESQYNDAIDEIVKSAKYSPLERIYYEAQLPDQLSNDISLKEKTKEHLDYLESKGVNQNDIIVAKEILRMREDSSGKQLDFEGFVVDTINFKGKDIANEIYLGLIKIFEVAGRDISKSTTILYNRLFLDLPF